MALVARNLAASRQLYRVSLVAKVESEEDIRFWRYVFSQARPDLKVKFLPSEIGNDMDVRQRGKAVCMRYATYLTKGLVICVDSDFDRFVRPGTLDAGKSVYQTYTYSFESHHCWGDGLQQTWVALGVCDFDFREFLKGLSEILYPVLIEMLTTKAATKNTKKKAWNLTELCGVVLSAQPNKAGMLEENGKLLLEEIGSKVKAWCDAQVHPDIAACEKMRAMATAAGLTEETAYLYMQGHCVFDLVERIGNTLCNGSHDFLYEVLMPSLERCNSVEMSLVLADLKNLKL